MVIIPTIIGQAHYTQRGIALLPGAAYGITLRWNALDRVVIDDEVVSDGAWYMDVLDGDDVPIARGIKLVLGTYPGRQSADPLFLFGAFVIVDTSGEHREARFDDLGTRVVLAYWLHRELISDAYATLPGGSKFSAR